jgi:hypothetical protein
MITLPLASGKIVDTLKYNIKLKAMIKVHQIVFSRRNFLFLYRSFLFSMSGGTRCQSTFTLGWSIFSGLVFLLAPRPFTFDLGVCFISTVNLPVSVLQDSLRASCGTYKDHQTCRLYCSILRGS